MIKYFRLTTSIDQYSEFIFGVDSFILEFKYNEINNRYYLNIYKNNKLVLRSVKLVWSRYNLLSSYEYKGIGKLNLISSEIALLEDNKTQILQELNRDNITKFVFRWEYNYE